MLLENQMDDKIVNDLIIANNNVLHNEQLFDNINA